MGLTEMATITWAGTSGIWSTPTQWVGTIVPTATDTAAIGSSTGTDTVVLNDTENVGGVVLNGTNAVVELTGFLNLGIACVRVVGRRRPLAPASLSR